MDAFSGHDNFRLLLGMLGFAAGIGFIWFVGQTGRIDSRLLAEAAVVENACRSALDKLVVDSEHAIPEDEDAVEYNELGARCWAEYEVWTDLVSIRVHAEAHGPPPCDELEQYGLEPAAIAYASEYGYCSLVGAK